MIRYRRMLIFILVVALCIFIPMQISRAFVESSQIEIVSVKRGDTIWSIAAKYSADDEDIRMKIMKIRRLNKLAKDLNIYPGQVLKVPVSF